MTLVLVLAIVAMAQSGSEILNCRTENGAVFYTNAASCAAADLGNRISIVEHEIIPPPAGGEPSANARHGTARKARKPLLSDAARRCRFPLGRALHLEKLMRRADSPGESIWLETYCRWVCEARTGQCNNLNGYLRHAQLCPTRTECR